MNKSVVSLELSGLGLVGTLSSALGALSNLTLLDASYNKLQGTLPATVSTLQNLQVLQLQSSGLRGSLPTSLCSLKQLSAVQVCNNASSKHCSLCIPHCLDDLSRNQNAYAVCQATGRQGSSFIVFMTCSDGLLYVEASAFMTDILPVLLLLALMGLFLCLMGYALYAIFTAKSPTSAWSRIIRNPMNVYIIGPDGTIADELSVYQEEKERIKPQADVLQV